MKKIAIVQPYLFPYLGYFQLANQVDEFWLYDCVQYIRRGWMNRNYLYNSGRVRKFVFSVNKGGRSDLIVQKNFSNDFKKDFRKSVAMYHELYAKEHGYVDGLAQLEVLGRNHYSGFSDATECTLRKLFSGLNIKASIRRTSTLGVPATLKGQDRIIEICKRVSASVYINPIGGQELYDAKDFFANGIDLQFIVPKPLNYLNVNKDELGLNGLSILDFIARVPPKEYEKFLSDSSLEYGSSLNG